MRHASPVGVAARGIRYNFLGAAQKLEGESSIYMRHASPDGVAARRIRYNFLGAAQKLEGESSILQNIIRR